MSPQLISILALAVMFVIATSVSVDMGNPSSMEPILTTRAGIRERRRP